MAEEYYVIPENPEYRLDNLRKIQNTDPVNAETIVNPLVLRMLENIAAVKKAADTAQSTAESGTSTRQSELIIPAVGWAAYEGGGVYLDIQIENVTAEMIPELTISRASEDAAAECAFAAGTDTYDGGLRVYAETAPEETITATLKLQYSAATGGVHIATDEEAEVVIEDLMSRHSDGSGGNGNGE